MKNNHKLKENITTEELEKLANKCLHCGGLPKAYTFTYEEETKWMFECKCGISTLLFNTPEELLKIWNSVYIVMNAN